MRRATRQQAAATVIFALLCAVVLSLVPLAASAQSASASLLVKLVAGLSPEQQAAVIMRNGGIETSSIPALRLHVIQVTADQLDATLARYQADPQVQSAEANKVRLSESIPSDPLYVNQWALPTIGWDQVFGVITPTGSAKVALLDTGVDAFHPELAGKVVPGTSILDGSNGMTDPSGHGTWLAGIIAAQTDTTEGIAGVAYAGVQIMPVTVLNANGEGMDSDVIAGVIWAVDHGADVILMAFSNPGFSPNLQDAIDYAWSRGVVLVAAAGNDASSDPHFPAGDRGVMGVAATDPTDALAWFSNSGQAVFIAGPGTDIQTTDINGNYIVISGTSASAAYVAGVAAFMKAVDTTLTNGIIVGRIARNADPAGPQDQTGNGRINMPRALADTSTDPIEPAGADPVGQGGPFVGPYVAAARSLSITFGGTGGGSLAISVNVGTISYPITGSGACTGATGNGTASIIIVGTCNLSLSNNAALASITATPNAVSTFSGWTGSLGTCSGTTNPCSPGTLGGGSNPLTVTFNLYTIALSPGSGHVGDTVTVTGTAFGASKPITMTFDTGSGVVSIGGACNSNASGAFTCPFVVPSAAGGNRTVSASDGTNTATATFALIAITLSPASSTYGTSPTITVAGGGFRPNQTILITGAAVTGPSACSTPMGGSTFSCTFAASATANAGTYTVSATESGGGSPRSASATFTIAKAQPVVTFGAAPTPTYLGGNFTVSASTSNTDSATLTYSQVSGPCAVVNASTGVFSSSGAGTCKVQASGAETTNFLTASNTQDMTIAKAASTTTFGPSPTPTYLGGNFTVSASNDSGGAITYSQVSGPCAVVNAGTGVFSSSGAGSCVVRADSATTPNYLSSFAQQTVTIAKAQPVVTFGTAPTPTYLGGNFTGSASTTNTDSATLTYSVVSGPCALVSGATFSSTGAGTCKVQASGAETANFLTASNTQDVTIAKAASTTTFGPAPTPTYLGGNFTVSASNDSGGAITYSQVSGPCALVSGATFSPSGAGSCVVRADSAATPNNLSSFAQQTVTIAKAASTTTFGAAPTPTYLGGNFTVSASNDSSAAITYSQVSGPCAVVNASTGVVSSSGAGSCVVRADSATTTNYLASFAQQTVTIAKAQPVVTFGAAPTPTYLGGNFTVNASTTNTDSGVLTYSRVSGPCALVSGATFSSSGAGTCKVQASGAETANFLAAANTQDVTIAKAASTTTFGAAPTPTYLGGNFTVSASNDSSGAITYSQVSGPCALVSGATFSSSGAGSCVVRADSAPTTNYLASFAQQTVTIA
jgi:hypothetical protein